MRHHGAHGPKLYLVGGIGMNLALVSHDGDDTFQRMPLCREAEDEFLPIVDIDGDITGLRGTYVEGDTICIAAQFGKLLRSTNGGRSFENVNVGATSVLQTVLRADGRLWATGDGGAY